MGSGVVISRALKKYGKENFSKIHLEECDSQESLNASEKYWISRYDALNNDEFYNIAAGGEFGDMWSGQSRYKKTKFKKRIAESNRLRKLPDGFNKGQKNGAYGRHWYKDKHTRKGYFLYENDPLIAQLGLVPGVFRSKAHNAKISKAHKGKKKNYVVASAGKKFMNDGKKSFYVKPEDVNDMLAKGYKLGQIHTTKGKVRMTNGHKNLYVSKSDVSKYVKRGYVNGWIQVKDLLS